MNDPKVEKQKPVPPFVQFCCAAIPQVFDDSLSYYEALCAMWKYLDETVKVINNNAMITEDFVAKVNELKDYVDHYFDNLDVQEEINNKLDAMVEAGTLQEIIAEYLDANVTWTFDTVADMKLATNLIDGSYARTLGFHSIGDGGASIYKISDTGTADEMEVIAVGDLFATLVKPTVVNPEIFGAYGDGIHADTDAIQKAINSGYPVKMTKDYLIMPIYIGNQDPSITRGWKENISIDASSAKFTYTGGNSAFVLAGIQGADIKFGRIDATSGSCIEMWSTNGNVRIAYLTLTFNQLNAGEKAIYIHPTTGSSGTGFINEVNINGGTIYSGDYGIYVDSTNESSGGVSGHRYNCVAFEGCDNCMYFGGTHAEFRGITWTDIRFVENDEAPLLEVHGTITDCRMHTWSRLYPSRLNLSDATCNRFMIECPLSPNRTSGNIGTGMYIDGSRTTYLNNSYSSKSLTNATGASGTVVIINQMNQLSLSFVGVYGTSNVQTLVTAENSPCKPIRRIYTTLVDAGGTKVGQASIETSGEIVLRTSNANVGTALNGSLSFISDDIKKF